MGAVALELAGLLIAVAGLIILVASFRPRMRRFWPFGATLESAGLICIGAASLTLHHWIGYVLLFMAAVMLAIIAKVASTAPGVR